MPHIDHTTMKMFKQTKCPYLSDDLRVVQTQPVSFLKSLSERVGSDIERLRIFDDFSYLYQNVLKSIDCDIIEIQGRSMSDPTFSDIVYKKNEMAWVWTTLNRIIEGIVHSLKFHSMSKCSLL